MLQQQSSPAPSLRVAVVTDPDVNPRTDFDNVGTMFCRHSKYELGDKDAEDPIEHVEGAMLDERWISVDELLYAIDMLTQNREQLEFSMEINDTDIIEEYGLWTAPATQAVEAILANAVSNAETRAVVRSDVAVILPLFLYDHSGITISTGPFSCKWDSGFVGFVYCTKQQVQANWNGDLDKAKACLESEVEEYDTYLVGNVWGFEIQDGEHEESCYGFYGDSIESNGMLQYVDPKYQAALHEAWDRRFQ